MVKGKPNYAAKPKIVPGDPILATGVSVGPKIAKTSIIMLITCCLYLIVQIPALMASKDFPKHMSPMEIFDAQAAQVNLYAMIGFVACMAFFVAYLGYQFVSSDAGHDEKSAGIKVAAIRNGQVTLRGVMHGMIEKSSADGQLLDISEREKNQMKDILRPFFCHYDNDNNQILSKYEFGKIMADLKEDLTQEAEMALFDSADVDKSGAIDFEEFCSLMVRYTKNEVLKEQTRGASKKDLKSGGLSNGPVSNGNGNGAMAAAPLNDGGDAAEDDDDEEEEEMPDDLKDLSPEEQQTAIKARACWMMGMGTVLVLVFSDPAVGVLSNIGTRLNVSAFYISFILAPLASNASELVAAYNYGCKKTQAMMTISLSTLLGAGCMNNTFCLAIFFMIIWKQQLTWNYTAEVTSIIFIEIVVGLFALKTTQKVLDATVVLMMYPLSLVIVWAMQNILNIP
jgi:Ca2+/Na+ antiporter